MHLSHRDSSQLLAERLGRRRLRWESGCSVGVKELSCSWQGYGSSAALEPERDLPNYCPACGATQRTVLLGAVGYARLQTQFYDKRKAGRNLAQATPVWRIEQENHVGRIDVVYVCSSDACGARVSPGVTHIRSWTRPDYWVPIPKKPRAALEKQRRPRPKKRKKRKK